MQLIARAGARCGAHPVLDPVWFVLAGPPAARRGDHLVGQRGQECPLVVM
jgi:hypothetical protein